MRGHSRAVGGGSDESAKTCWINSVKERHRITAVISAANLSRSAWSTQALFSADSVQGLFKNHRWCMGARIPPGIT
ncbi:hypothetical protein NSND_60861 [Nitrospira sp. ND1]|nr:hypothetical protein NSND_60861 [Nitrospira sp. ND1]